MATTYTTSCNLSLTSIDGIDCIGDSRTYINGNVLALGNNDCYLLSLINTLSSNMDKILNVPYLEYAWVCAPSDAAQTIAANTVTTLSANTEVADIGNYGSLSNNQITLGAGTYRYEAYVPLTSPGPNNGRSILSLYQVSPASQYISRNTVYDSDSNSSIDLSNRFDGQFTIAATAVFELRLLVNIASTIGSSGGSNSTSDNDQRTTIRLWKVG